MNSASVRKPHAAWRIGYMVSGVAGNISQSFNSAILHLLHRADQLADADIFSQLCLKYSIYQQCDKAGQKVCFDAFFPVSDKQDANGIQIS